MLPIRVATSKRSAPATAASRQHRAASRVVNQATQGSRQPGSSLRRWLDRDDQPISPVAHRIGHAGPGEGHHRQADGQRL